MANKPKYTGLYKVATKLTLGKCECGKDIEVDVELVRDEEDQPQIPEANIAKEAAHDDEESGQPVGYEDTSEEGLHPEDEEDPLFRGASATNRQEMGSLSSLVKKASLIVDQLDTVANQVENKNPRLAARIDAVSNEIEKRVARLLQRRQNAR